MGPMGEIVIEGAWNYTKEAGATTNAAGFAFVYGLGFAEIAIEGPYVWTEDENGFGDFIFFGKVGVLGSSEKEGMFTVKAEAKSKTGDEEKGLGSGSWEFAGSGVFSKGFGPLTLHSQLGYNYVKGDTDSNAFFYGLALDVEVHDKISLVAEFIWNYNTKHNHQRPMSLLAGIIFKLPNVYLDAGLGKGLNDEADDWTATAGITLVF